MSNGFHFYEGSTTDSATTPKITVRRGGVPVLTQAAVDMPSLRRSARKT